MLKDFAGEVASATLQTMYPGVMKSRCNSLVEASHFDGARNIWDSKKFTVISRAVLAKFTQSPAMAEALLATGTMPIVEASPPTDKFWGCGIAIQDLARKKGSNPPPPTISTNDIEKWTAGGGTNMAGFAVMSARQVLRDQGGFSIQAIPEFRPAVEKEIGSVRREYQTQMKALKDVHQAEMNEQLVSPITQTPQFKIPK